MSKRHRCGGLFGSRLGSCGRRCTSILPRPLQHTSQISSSGGCPSKWGFHDTVMNGFVGQG